MVESPPVTEKLHAACDECRTRKLKCSGQHPTCSRCERENINCRYSPQKPMGRPRKRRREDGPVPSAEPVGEQQPLPTTSLPDNFEPPVFDHLSTPPGFDDALRVDGFDFSNGLLPPSNSGIDMNNQLVQEATPPTLSFDPNPIDPSLWNLTAPTNDPNTPPQSTNIPTETTPSDTGPCSCLSLMYLTVSDLQTITNFSFPQVVPRLRSAITAASTILHCPICPKQPFAAIQNVQSLSALLSAIAERYHRVLTEIATAAERAEAAGEKKSFRVGDNSPENRHLHTGTPDCPMGFDIELAPKDWSRMCKAALKTEVLGGGKYQTPLVKLLDEMEERQHRWHEDKTTRSKERSDMFGTPTGKCLGKDGEALCMRMANSVRVMVSAMKWED
ncbi:hypothetical protein DM02DRAFT_317477 [Periconia macrospinosa]|uniref:Zn(2)-C6 fungal-type domain-containing protein n=1 Tax=Periconia macrospinosa TaxID=97972 RepID=A0A2V1DXK5_9PLEO|nr:hypothetical protein DM02DRAFT_317477 [Periconia macrospinosa]